jgi:hypothetical protein
VTQVRWAVEQDLNRLAELLEAARQHAEQAGAVRMELATATAQRLYAALGWARDDEFYRYSLRLR